MRAPRPGTRPAGPDPEVRALSAKGLGDAPTASSEPDARETGEVMVFRPLQTQVIDGLRAALADPDVRVAVEAVRSLIKLKAEVPAKLDRVPVALAAAQAGAATETDDPEAQVPHGDRPRQEGEVFKESEGCGPLALHEAAAAPPEKYLSGRLGRGARRARLASARRRRSSSLRRSARCSSRKITSSPPEPPSPSRSSATKSRFPRW